MKLVDKSEFTKEMFTELPVWDYSKADYAAALFCVVVDSVQWNVITTGDEVFKVTDETPCLRRSDYNELVSSIKRPNGSFKDNYQHKHSYDIVINSEVVYSNRSHAIAGAYVNKINRILDVCSCNVEIFQFN